MRLDKLGVDRIILVREEGLRPLVPMLGDVVQTPSKPAREERHAGHLATRSRSSQLARCHHNELDGHAGTFGPEHCNRRNI